MEIFLIVLVIAFFPIFSLVSYFVLAARISRLREELEQKSQAVDELWLRIRRLELEPSAPPGVPARQPEPAEPAPAPQPPSHPIAPAEIRIESPPLPQPTLDTPEPQPRAEPLPTFADRLRAFAGTTELEELLGGSILNKAGALLMVVGLALFLSYSFRYRMGPAARVATATALSAGLLAGGIVLSRRGYRLFSAGLIGSGWAGLYFTTYAAGAAAPAKIIDNPYVATLLLLAVAAAMIVHTLRRGSEAVTGVAYSSAFAALAISPLTPLAVVSLLPLAASLLWIANRRDWSRMALFGCLATWGTLISRGDSGSPLWRTQVLFVAFWLLFEAFELARLRHLGDRLWSSATFGANAFFFLTLSYLKWGNAAPDQTYLMAGGTALLFCASAMMRLLVNPPEPGVPLDRRLLRGSFEAPLAIGAVLAGLAVFDKPTVWAGSALVLEAEALIVIGLRFGIRFPQALGWVGLLAAAFRMIDGGGSMTVLGRFAVTPATPVLVLLAAAWYGNTAMRTWGWRVASFCAPAMATLAISIEAPWRLRGLLILLWAFGQLEFAWRRPAEHLRLPSFATGIAALFAMLWSADRWLVKFAPFADWLPVATAGALCFATAARFREESAEVRKMIAGVSCALAMAATWIVLPDVMVAMAWIALAMPLAEMPLLEVHAHALAAAAFARLFFANFTNDGVTLTISHRLLSVLPVTASLYHLWRKFGRREYPWAVAIAIAVLLRFELGRVHAATGWAAMAMLLVWLGERFGISDLRRQSQILAGLAFVRSWASNFFDPLDQNGDWIRILSALAVVAALYASQFLSPRKDEPSRWTARSYYSLLATALLFFLLLHEVSGALLTVAWGLQGALTLVAGFALRERLLRLPGLAILFLCIAKLFVHDLGNLETPYRILSFVALGAILLGISWVYTRFRERIQQFL